MGSQVARGKKLTATAYHEAGHAVAAYWLPYASKTTTLSIVAVEDAWGYHDTADAPPWDPEGDGLSLEEDIDSELVGMNPELRKLKMELEDLKRIARVESEIIVLYAGPEAERRYRGRYNKVGATSDRSRAVLLASLVVDSCKDSYLEYCVQRAKALIDSRWRMIETLAEALLEHDTLSGEKVKAILDKLIPA